MIFGKLLVRKAIYYRYQSMEIKTHTPGEFLIADMQIWVCLHRQVKILNFCFTIQTEYT